MGLRSCPVASRRIEQPVNRSAAVFHDNDKGVHECRARDWQSCVLQIWRGSGMILSRCLFEGSRISNENEKTELVQTATLKIWKGAGLGSGN